MTKPFFRHHLFFCQNQHQGDLPCCASHDAASMCAYAKERCKELGLHGPGGIRINKAGCLGRCERGPVAVVYPEGVWYNYIDREDIDEIINSHLREGKIVERLRIHQES